MNSLYKKKILICRPQDKCGEMVKALEECGAVPTIFATATMEILPIDATIEQHLRRLATPQWIIFSSTYGVEAFCQLAAIRSITPAQLMTHALGIVGTKSAQLLQQKFPQWQVTLTKNSLQELLDTIATYRLPSFPPSQKVCVWHPTSRESLEKIAVTIPETLELIRVPLYTGKPAPPKSQAERDAIRNAQYDAIILGSPSAYDCLVDVLGEELLATKTPLAVLGGTTKKYLEERGWRAMIVPARPHVADLMVALEQFFGQ